MPYTLVSKTPEQEPEESLPEYFNRFEDYLLLESYVKNTVNTLDNPNHIDVLLNGTDLVYRQYLQSQTYEERKDPSLAYKYKKDTLLSTLKSKLQQPNSPTLNPSKHSAFARTPPFRNRNSPRKNPYYQRSQSGTTSNPIVINQIATTTDPDLAQACDELDALTPPSDPEASKAYTKYAVSINKIATDRNLAYSQPCLICKTQSHDFANCPVLQNIDFLKQHYINFMQMLKKHDRARSASNAPPATPQSAKIFQLQATHPDDRVYLFPPVQSPASSPTLLAGDEPTRAASAPPTSDFH